MVRTRTTRTQQHQEESCIFSHNHLKNPSSRAPAAMRCSWAWCYELAAVATVNACTESVSMTFARALSRIRLGTCTDRLVFQFTILFICCYFESIHQNDKVPQKYTSSEFWWDMWYQHDSDSPPAPVAHFIIHFVDNKINSTHYDGEHRHEATGVVSSSDCHSNLDMSPHFARSWFDWVRFWLRIDRDIGSQTHGQNDWQLSYHVFGVFLGFDGIIA